MKCTQCQAENADETRFCEACGASMLRPTPPPACPSCGSERRASAKFCASCGHRFTDESPPGPLSAPGDPLAEIRLGAIAGDAEAQFQLGLAYDTGEGVAENNREAVHWFRKAADQHHARAQYYLGIMYSTGQGVAQDEVAAVDWTRKSAEQGDMDAQFSLGLSYASGIGVPLDHVLAQDWYRKAAQLGHVRAQAITGETHSPKPPPPPLPPPLPPPPTVRADPLPQVDANPPEPKPPRPPPGWAPLRDPEEEALPSKRAEFQVAPGPVAQKRAAPSDDLTPVPASRDAAVSLQATPAARKKSNTSVIWIAALSLVALATATALYLNRPTAEPAQASELVQALPLPSLSPSDQASAVVPETAEPVSVDPAGPDPAAAALATPAPPAAKDTAQPPKPAPETTSVAAPSPKPAKPKAARTPVAQSAPLPVAPVAPVAAPIEAPPVAASPTLDQQYEQRRGECKGGFIGSNCRKKIRVQLCAEKWADTPEAGMSVCQTKNK